jgi:hypothetical protein
MGHFSLLDPDPATQINADPDPQPWPPVFLIRYGYREVSIIRTGTLLSDHSVFFCKKKVLVPPFRIFLDMSKF